MPKIAATTPMNAAIIDADAKRVPRASARPPPSATTSTPSGTPPAAQSPISPMAASSEPHDKAADPANGMPMVNDSTSAPAPTAVANTLRAR